MYYTPFVRRMQYYNIIDEPCVWVESIFVVKEYRRKRISSALFEKAEEIAKAYGEETVYNYVHPNNNGMIAFNENQSR